MMNPSGELSEDGQPKRGPHPTLSAGQMDPESRARRSARRITTVPRLVFESVLRCSVEDLWRFHSDASALRVLTPKGTQMLDLTGELGVAEGARQTLRVRKFGVVMEWRAHLTEVQPPRQFRDTAEKSPFASWTHLHEFLPHPDGALLRDTVDYRMPLGPLGWLVDVLLIRRDVESIFRHRHEATRQALASSKMEA